MRSDVLPFFPDQASTLAGEVDALYLFLVGVSAFFTVLIFGLVFYFAVRYRRRAEDERPKPIVGSFALEMIWTVVPLGLVMVMFVWGASLYFKAYRPPREAMEILVTGKQWMWKFQHPTGQREINELHLPAGQPVKLTMASEDVIHSLYIPAFRVKKDVVPGTYTSLWFEATRVGEYHLFCAEYCGTEHSGMTGTVVVMEPLSYERWLAGAAATGEPVPVAGLRLFRQYACNTCHDRESTQRGPSLHGLFGSEVSLTGGETVVADDRYIRESIVNPRARQVESYLPLMPTYQGQLSEEQILQLVSYIKSLEGAPSTRGQQ